MNNLPKIALGTWPWGAGFAGSDQVFGNTLTDKELKSVFDTAINNGLNLIDTALVYGMGTSETTLGGFVKDLPREKVVISTKFTPQLAEETDNPVATMFEKSLQNLNTDYIDIYWIHNPIDAPKWIPFLVP
ncbi:MAG: aldo/keto reductase, partial [Cruoricaptor ignavus]|nr:aldo/keto reductase [Cruoricaptor ignavus]